MLNLHWPWAFLVLPLPFLFWKFLPAARQQQASALRIPFFTAVQSLSDTLPHKKSLFMLLFISLIWGLLVLSASRRVWLGDPVPIRHNGRDLLLAIDLSGSMEQNDFQHNGQSLTRLDVVKATASRFIQDRQGDRIGLILFGERPYTQTPLTFDHTSVVRLLGESEIGLAGKSTAIGDAIGLAIKRMQKLSKVPADDTLPHHNQVLILLTDGANTAGELDPLMAAKLAKTHQLKIYTIGLCADKMLSHSVFGSRVINPSKDLDEDMLKKIANITGVLYFRARDTHALATIYQQLDQLEPSLRGEAFFRPIQSLFHWPLGLAWCLSVLLAIQYHLRHLFTKTVSS